MIVNVKLVLIIGFKVAINGLLNVFVYVMVTVNVVFIDNDDLNHFKKVCTGNFDLFEIQKIHFDLA